MPEGHSVHRIARQFQRHFVGKRVSASSPQGRFAAGAGELDGHVMTDARAVGKQMFLEFDHERWLRVHLGMYGAWDFAGDITADATVLATNGRMGQTNQKGTPERGGALTEDGGALTQDGVLGRPVGLGQAVGLSQAVGPGQPVGLGQNVGPGQRASVDAAGEDSIHSIGAPRVARLRMAEQEKLGPVADSFPPEPVGAVRVRLLTHDTVADLRGPTACEVLSPEEVQAVIARLGPDPLVDPGKRSEDRFVAVVRKKPTPIGLLLMDQSVVSGIGNVYRAELLFRARLNPHTPGRDVPEETVRALWRDWSKLLKLGVQHGQMMTMDGLRAKQKAAALAHRADRHWVYHRAGLACRVCGTPIAVEMAAGRKLYWCPKDQA